MSKTVNTRIALRKDDLSNWTASNPVLNDGELAIVTNEDGSESIKLGNGLSSFSQLPYLYQSELKTDKLTSKAITAKSISQGYRTSSTPTSMATGVFTEANGQFGVVHGIEARAKQGDDYAFVFNGTNLPLDGQNFYESHGEGSFSVNPLSGLNGFWIGDRSLSSILSGYLLSSEIGGYYRKSETSSAYQISSKIHETDLSIRQNMVDISAVSSHIPLSVSQLENDVGNATSSDVSAMIREMASKYTVRVWTKTQD